jgi:hypothetical protein
MCDPGGQTQEAAFRASLEKYKKEHPERFGADGLPIVPGMTGPGGAPIAVATSETLAAGGPRPPTAAQLKEDALLKQPAPDIADAALRAYARNQLLKNRNQSMGRAGAFNLPNPAQIASRLK